MSQGPQPRWFQFRLRDLMLAVTCYAAWVGILCYARPRHLLLLIIAPLVALTAGSIIGGVGVVAAGRGRWWTPLAVAAVCFAAFALGLWAQMHFYP